MSKLRFTEKQRHGQPLPPALYFLTGHVLRREGSCRWEHGEGTSDTSSFSPPSSVFAFCHLHKLVSIRTPLDCKPDCHPNPQAEGQDRVSWRRAPEPRPPPHTHYTFSSWRIPSCFLFGGRLVILVLYFESFTRPTLPKRVPAPTPTLSSEPSERKPPHTPWCSSGYALVRHLSSLSVKTTPQSDSSPLKSEAELVPSLSDPGCHLGASVHLHNPGNTRGLRKKKRCQGPSSAGDIYIFLGAHVTRFTTPSHASIELV